MTFRIFLDILILINAVFGFAMLIAIGWAVIRVIKLEADQLSLAQILQTVVSKSEPTQVVGFKNNEDE